MSGIIGYEENQRALGNSAGTTYVMTGRERRARDRELKRSRRYNIDMEAAKNGAVKTNVFDLIGGFVGQLKGKDVDNRQPFVADYIPPKVEKKKDNTLLYVVGLMVLLAGIYFATQKK